MSFYPPPSYEDSSYRQLWPIIAAYVLPKDLLAACLVSREWHKAFAPQLWTSPARRFEGDIDDVYFSLSKFRSLLLRARLEVRSLTRTIRIPEGDLELYEGPRPEWLRHLFDQLPSLQSLILPGHQYFDHHALNQVNQTRSEKFINPHLYPLRMLNASKCGNITGTSLAALLDHLPDLIYLDLSDTPGPRNTLVLPKIASLRELRVLRLRNCKLGDEFAEALKLPSSLLSLDLSGNNLTARGVSIILQKLPQVTYSPPSERFQRYQKAFDRDGIFAGILDEKIARRLQGGSAVLTNLDEILPTSFSQLNLSDNATTVEDILQTLEHLGLDHLDCGSLALCNVPADKLVGSTNSPNLDAHLLQDSLRNIRSLRICHNLVTNAFTDLKRNPVEVPFSNLNLVGHPRTLQAVASGFLQAKSGSNFLRHPNRFSPSMLPNLKILALTKLPSSALQPNVTEALMTLFQECAVEENVARLEYLFRIQSPDNPPQWKSCAGTPYKLRRIILELREGLSHQDFDTSNEHKMPQRPRRGEPKVTTSATEDPDGEMFMQAGQEDFSFFTDDNNGDVVRDGRVDDSAFGVRRALLESKHGIKKRIETIPTIAAFRKERKARYDSLSRSESTTMGSLLCGHWIGEVRVIRPSRT